MKSDRITVIIPVKVRETEDTAPWISPSSTALLVPMACEHAPIATPWVIGSVILNSFIRIGDRIFPVTPVTITANTVIDWIPFKDELTAIAIGVVILLGIKENVKVSDRVNSLHSAITQIIDVREPTKVATVIVIKFFFINSRCL